MGFLPYAPAFEVALLHRRSSYTLTINYLSNPSAPHPVSMPLTSNR
jgi:hypothetical protein